MKLVLNLSFILFTSLLLNAQEKQIYGIVTSDSDGLPLPGVSVIIEGTSISVQTNFDGYYKIRASVGDVLVYTFVGIRRQKVKVGNTVEINVALKEDLAALETVVISAYSGASNSSRVKNNWSKPTLSSTLSGRAAGVSTKSKSRNYGIGRKNVMSVSSEPLYVLDGRPISEEKFRSIKTDKLKHVEILNSLQGKTVYGYEGSKGVIVLRTKGPRNNVNFDIINDFLNESYVQIHENAFKRSTLAPLSTFSIDVDKAAYSNIRRMINNGQEVPRNAVKIEEMLNYFSYDYSQPRNTHPFAIHTEVVQTPWHNKTQLVRIGLQGKTYDNDKLPASNLTFLIDVSGSMDATNKLHLLKKSFKLLVNQLREKDRVSIVVYAGAAGVVLTPTSGDKKEIILEALERLQAGGSTAGGQGIKLAYELAEQNFKKDGNNRVILATDGDFNVGASSDSDMQTLIEKKRESGVFLSVLGFGYGNYKDSKLEMLADKGNGNYSYIDNMQEAQKVFGKEFGGTLYTIAKDVKIQVEFNPKKVQAYRLIGYENRLLADEDFIDDTKDAGELGSGHTVTALYEVIPVGVSSHYLKNSSNLKYTKNEITNNYTDELFTVKFRYKKPDGDKSIEMVHVQDTKISIASEDMNFASAVALIGMNLLQSQYDNGASMKDVIRLAKQGRGNDDDGYRAEFIRLVESYRYL
ncbi:vWA domain-containing protein [Psychroserpens burtonensis]|uniref:vWA domain-containing protein n=1 Tax=Psychroserpens burtonensis TaxID=49278 RepID=UPI0004274085|nr:VWA domain-containing protein [Psychroserpens burtonensis]